MVCRMRLYSTTEDNDDASKIRTKNETRREGYTTPNAKIIDRRVISLSTLLVTCKCVLESICVNVEMEAIQHSAIEQCGPVSLH